MGGSEFETRISILALAFGPDRMLAVGVGLEVRLFDLRVAEVPRVVDVLVGHSSNISSICFSADGRRVLAGANDGSVLLWERQAH
jgi:WD40 repeat protein